MVINQPYFCATEDESTSVVSGGAELRFFG